MDTDDTASLSCLKFVFMVINVHCVKCIKAISTCFQQVLLVCMLSYVMLLKTQIQHIENIDTRNGHTHTVTSDSCSLVRFRGWLMTVMPNSTGLADWGRRARRMALLATFMKATMACQPLLLYHTWQRRAQSIENVPEPFDLLIVDLMHNIGGLTFLIVTSMFKLKGKLLQRALSQCLWDMNRLYRLNIHNIEEQELQRYHFCHLLGLYLYPAHTYLYVEFALHVS